MVEQKENRVMSKETQIRYARTKKGLINKMFNSQKQRCKSSGRELQYDYPWLLKWAMPQNIYLTLYNSWVENDYSRDLIPTVDRIDSSKGYLKDNIQLLTWRENLSKQKYDSVKNKRKDNPSGTTGVRFDARNNWRASISVNGKDKHLGNFPKIEDAIQARKNAELKYWSKL